MSAPDDLMSAPAFERGLLALATSLGRVPDDVRSEAGAYLQEMSASFDHRMTGAWQRFGRWMLRAHDLEVDDGRVAAIRELDRDHTLVFLPAHRSYLDAWAYPEALISRGVSPIYSFGGNNINFFPLGSFASRTGRIFVRRATRELPVYRFVLRAYIAHLVRNRSNLAWSIEGGQDPHRQAATTQERHPPLCRGRRAGGRRTRGVRGAGLDPVRPAARGQPDDRGGAWWQEAAGGRALAGPPGTAAEPAAGADLRRLR